MKEKRAILIAGPTASGKSALAMMLAERVGGVVINADSMQVYAELRILTARPTPEEEARAPHRLYGHVPVREAYSVGRYAEAATHAIAAVRAQGRVPIIVGGTGLYFKALLEGLSPIPNIPDNVRAHWRAEAGRLPAGAAHGLLAGRDPEMAARLDPADLQRIVRALEVLEATGQSLAQWQREPGRPVLTEAETIRLRVQLHRSVLHQRCDARFATMLAAGAIEEAQAMADARLEPTLPAMRAIGLRPLLAHVRGEVGLATATEQAQAETRQYVKRQETWARRNYNTWRTVHATETERIDQTFFAFI